MSALRDAEQAVAEAREAVLWDSNRDSIAHLIAAVRRHDMALAQAEALHDNTRTDADEAYQQAIGDVVGAITAQIGETT